MQHRMFCRALLGGASPSNGDNRPLRRLAVTLLIACSLVLPTHEAGATRDDKPPTVKKVAKKDAAQRKQAAKPRAPARKDKDALKAARHEGKRNAPKKAGTAHVDARQEASHTDPDAPAVVSRTVLVFDETSGHSLYGRNDDHAQPIASITKLMTAMVVLDARLPMDETLTITLDDVDHLRGSTSRVPVGASMSREELLRLALMSSENRAAAALGRNFPGGTSAFVRAMNAKAAALGMSQSRFEDSTGLHGGNRASPMDLVRMVRAAHEYAPIREFSTTRSHSAELGRKHVEFRNTNALVRSPEWDIGLSKTGYIREAGRCLVMHARIAARPVVIVLLDGDGKHTRLGDAARIKKWLEARWRGDILASNT